MKLNFIKFLLAAESYLGFPLRSDGGLYRVPAGALVHLSHMAADYGYTLFAALENMETGEYFVEISPMTSL